MAIHTKNRLELARRLRKLETELNALIVAAHDYARDNSPRITDTGAETIYTEYFRRGALLNRIASVAAALEAPERVDRFSIVDSEVVNHGK